MQGAQLSDSVSRYRVTGPRHRSTHAVEWCPRRFCSNNHLGRHHQSQLPLTLPVHDHHLCVQNAIVSHPSQVRMFAEHNSHYSVSLRRNSIQVFELHTLGTCDVSCSVSCENIQVLQNWSFHYHYNRWKYFKCQKNQVFTTNITGENTGTECGSSMIIQMLGVYRNVEESGMYL